MQSLSLTKLDLAGLKILVKWAAKEGWNPGPFDAEVFFATDPDGFFGYFEGDELVAGGSIVSYDGDFGFMGFFIVKPTHRSRGIGRQLWFQRRDMLLSRLKAGACIGMDGVVAMQSFYQKGGFEVAYRDERRERSGMTLPSDPYVSLVEDSDIQAILAYDRLCFGFPRDKFLLPWLRQPDVKAFKYHEDGILKGFAVVRGVESGYKIGPLFADNDRVAEALYRACLNIARGEPVVLDIPAIHPGARALADKYETTLVFECARMYHGRPPDHDLKRVYGITTFELG